MKKLFIGIATITSLAACKKEKSSAPQFNKNVISYNTSISEIANLQYNTDNI